MTSRTAPISPRLVVEERLLARNPLVEAFFAREAPASPTPAARCRNAFCGGPAAGLRPRALRDRRPACLCRIRSSGDRWETRASCARYFHDVRPWLESILHSDDIVMGFGPPEATKMSSRLSTSRILERRHDLRTSRAPTHPMRSRPLTQIRLFIRSDRDSLPCALGNCARFLRASRTRS